MQRVLSLTLSVIIGTVGACSPDCDVCLIKGDFEYGTYRIQEPGQYCLSENIYFNPSAGKMDQPNRHPYWFPADDDAYPGCLTQSDGAYALGFFAAISVEASNVVLDLQGHVLQMHWHFYLQQSYLNRHICFLFLSKSSNISIDSINRILQQHRDCCFAVSSWSWPCCIWQLLDEY